MKQSSGIASGSESASDRVLAAQAQAKFNEGKILHQNRQLAQAQQAYLKVLEIQPEHFDALLLLGAISYQTEDPARAAQWISKAIHVNPNNAAAHSNLGVVLNNLKQHQAAIDSYDKAIAIKPDYADAYSNRGNALNDLKQYQAAVASYDKAIALRPDLAEAHYNRGNALNDLKQHQAAVDSYDKAIALKPGFAKVYYNRGDALNELRRYQEAVDSYDKAIALKPDYVEAYYNRGNAQSAQKQFQAAVESFDQAIAIKPDYAEAYSNRGNALRELGQYQEAIDSYSSALTYKRDLEILHGVRLHTKMKICDWRDADIGLAEKVQQGQMAIPPFGLLALSSALPLQRRLAELCVNEKFPSSLELGNIRRHARSNKIRIGYFSMDFRNHAISFLTAELFETHDRDRFEVYAFSYGPDTRDKMRMRLEGAFDRFIDVRDKSDKEIAKLARQMEIDIAIDLAGFTGDSRPGIFALRAAPIQVNYLGYPGTMGAQYMDYLIADKTLIPEESQQHYSEKIVYLPSFQVNDSKREISDKVFTRKELGLPESGFVFCCFNNNYKITPATFGGWMRILKRADQSVLFLYAENPLVITNLRREADLAGVDSDRLVFGTRLPVPEYLARYRSADLFLDTLPFNGGTTASNALWAGLPVLTCTGEAFSSRMAASLLNAIGLPELITSTKEEYEALAVELATDADKLKAIRQKLQENRLSQPLFDTKRFTRNIENAYTQMVERYQADLAPEDIYVESKVPQSNN